MFLFLMELSGTWGIRHRMQPFGLGDISLRNGTAPPTHDTHRFGGAVDIYVIHSQGLRRSSTSNKVNVAREDLPETYDAKLTDELVHMAVGMIRRGYPKIQFLFDDQTVLRKHAGVIESKADKPHHDHFHIQLSEHHPYTKEQTERMLQRSQEEWYCGF
jgi:hypothetical protein